MKDSTSSYMLGCLGRKSFSRAAQSSLLGDCCGIGSIEARAWAHSFRPGCSAVRHARQARTRRASSTSWLTVEQSRVATAVTITPLSASSTSGDEGKSPVHRDPSNSTNVTVLKEPAHPAVSAPLDVSSDGRYLSATASFKFIVDLAPTTQYASHTPLPRRDCHSAAVPPFSATSAPAPAPRQTRSSSHLLPSGVLILTLGRRSRSTYAGDATRDS